jgi:hypothetical protein
MELTEDIIVKLRELNQGNSLKVNGKEYQVVDIQTYPEPRFELKGEKETKEEGLEIYLADSGKEIEDPPFFSADLRLIIVDYMVDYGLLESRDGILDLSKEYSHDHLIVHDYDNERTGVYGSTYSKKDITDVKIKLLDLDEDVIKIESLEF